ncbi:hypothetical protein ACH4LK_22645 [Streptomyces lydicus]|uniref:hypothetical protein n=1 Tax=Streptomyces lydicus TaxID=47763 RepID=UPI0037882108
MSKSPISQYFSWCWEALRQCGRIILRPFRDPESVDTSRNPKIVNWSPWSARALSRINYLRSQNDIEKGKRPLGRKERKKRIALTSGVEQHLKDAQDALRVLQSEVCFPFTQGRSLERIWSHLRAADVTMLELVSEEDLASRSNEVLEMAKAHLRQDNAQRAELERRIKKIRSGKVHPVDRGVLIHTLDAAYGALDQELTRVRSLRNMLITASLVVMIGVGVLVVYGWLSPKTFSLCFLPRNAVNSVVCPSHVVPLETGKPYPSSYASSADILAVEVAGLCGAALTVIASLRHIPATSRPYGLPLAAAMLKFPTGALTAFTGILLIRGAFIPGLSNLDTKGQVLAWAVIFGASQHLVTRLVDNHARETLSEVSLEPGTEPPQGKQGSLQDGEP